MRAVSWAGKGKVAVSTPPDPEILNPHDAIVRVTYGNLRFRSPHLWRLHPHHERRRCSGTRIHGRGRRGRQGSSQPPKGDRVVVPFAIACGQCFFCRHELWSLCDNTNPNAWMADRLYGESGAGLFGYSHLFGGYPGGQAEYVRVPFADVGPLKVPEDLTDEQVLFLSDIFPTGFMAAENCNIRPGDTVAIWGCGPVGLFTIMSAFMLGAERVIAIDAIPERLQMASNLGAEVLDYRKVDVLESLKEMTGARGPDACIDAVGMESHGLTVGAIYDRAKQALMLESDRSNTLRQAIMACRKGGVVSVPVCMAALWTSFRSARCSRKG